MAFSEIQLPLDGAGKSVSTYTAPGAGPGGIDLFMEVAVVQPDNTVGRILHDVALQQIPHSGSDVSLIAVDAALHRLLIVNDGTGTTWVSVKSGDGNVAFSAKSIIPPGGYYLLDFGGMVMRSGITWQAGAANVTGGMKFYAAS
jgi:hypothetical protein